MALNFGFGDINMLFFISHYIFFGLGFYTGMSLKEPATFIHADTASIIRGFLLGILFWPIGLIIQVVHALEKIKL